MDFKEFEKQCNEIQKENNNLLTLFENDLIKNDLKPKTIYKHLSNVSFYINTYLLTVDPLTIRDGIYKLNDYFEYFYIRKCMWSTPSNIKTTAASLKKFYKCMLDYNKITEKAYKDLCKTIKDNMEYWQEECVMYNDEVNSYFEQLYEEDG